MLLERPRRRSEGKEAICEGDAGGRGARSLQEGRWKGGRDEEEAATESLVYVRPDHSELTAAPTNHGTTRFATLGGPARRKSTAHACASARDLYT